jgi:hypothetical protein
MALALGGVAEASSHHAKTIRPKLGVWEATPKGVSTGYAEGGWTLVREKGHVHMTAQPDYGGVFYPNSLKCSATYDRPLSKADYRISDKAKFHIRDTVPNETHSGKPLVQHVVWTGKFTKKKRVSGTISIWLTKAPKSPGAKPKVVCKDLHRKWSGDTP